LEIQNEGIDRKALGAASLAEENYHHGDSSSAYHGALPHNLNYEIRRDAKRKNIRRLVKSKASSDGT